MSPCTRMMLCVCIMLINAPYIHILYLRDVLYLRDTCQSRLQPILNVYMFVLRVCVVVSVGGWVVRFKDSAESETSQPSRICLGPLRDESESRVGRLNSEKADSAENRTSLGGLGIMMMILCLIIIQCGNNYINMYL